MSIQWVGDVGVLVGEGGDEDRIFAMSIVEKQLSRTLLIIHIFIVIVL